LRVGEVTIDFVCRQAWKANLPLELTYREFSLLRYLAERSGNILRRDELLREVWRYPESPHTRSVDHAIARLRQKIEPNPHRPRFIHTVHGDGYSLTSTDPPQGLDGDSATR
jgi:DNA-binding response OmpR family regulator